ncbi:zinc-ribbon domain-containing protein, partial [Eubacterium ruminantium]
MFCLKCGKQIPDGSGMCPVCGANLMQGGPQYGGMNPQQMGMQGGLQYGGMNPQQMGMQGG